MLKEWDLMRQVHGILVITSRNVSIFGLDNTSSSHNDYQKTPF